MTRIAMTETRNVYAPMPASVAALSELTGKLDEVRRANVDHHVDLLRDAAKQGAQIICFGELFTAPYFALDWNPMWTGLAEPVDGPTIKTLSAVCRELGVHLIAPIYELDGKERYNTAVVIDDQGLTRGRFRKVHIPQGENEQGAFIERNYYGSSTGVSNPHVSNVSSSAYFPVFDLGIAKVGVAICYDRHFEGVMRTLSQQGAEIVFCPAVTFGAKSERMWEIEFEVDAARHNLFVAGSNRKGIEPPWTQPYFGKSFGCGPNGRLENLSTHPELLVVEAPIEILRQPDPSGWKLQAHRRSDTYDL